MEDENAKIEHVLKKNTFWWFNSQFEEHYQGNAITPLTTLLHNFKLKVLQTGLRKQDIDDLLQHKLGLDALLALNGFSFEQLKRVITFSRIVKSPDLDNLLKCKLWAKQGNDKDLVTEWTTDSLKRRVIDDSAFRAGITNLLFEGASNIELARVLPPFELIKLSAKKLTFDIDSLIDTLVRYKEKGRYNASGDNNPEMLISTLLKKIDVQYVQGQDLKKLVSESFNQKRTIDFVIPNIQNPKILIESSYLSTTASGQGDKSKAEINVLALIKNHYPDALFIGFIDGIGWYVRRSDLGRMVSAYHHVFTYHPSELERFEILVKELLNHDAH